MSGPRGHMMNSRPAREIFLTSSSLSFSSLSSSVSWDDAIELNTKDLKISSEVNSQKNGEVSNASSSQGSEISGVTHVIRMLPAPAPPSRLGPAQLMNKGLGNYNPERIPASVFAKTGDMNWSEISNESLFSLKVDGYRKSNAQAARRSYVKPKKVLISGEYLRYTPSLLIRSGDAEEKRSEVEEIKSGETEVENRRSHQNKSSSTRDVSSSTNTNNSYSLNQAPPTKLQSFPLPVGEKKSKKTKRARRRRTSVACGLGCAQDFQSVSVTCVATNEESVAAVAEAQKLFFCDFFFFVLMLYHDEFLLTC